MIVTAVAVAITPTTPVTRLTVSLTREPASTSPRSRARSISSAKPASSKAASSTAEVVSNSRRSTVKLICGTSRACAHPAAMVSAPRPATAAAASVRAGSAARMRSGVGPAANSWWSTPVVASRPSVVSTPAATLRPSDAAVSRRLVAQARVIASRINAGSRRATDQNPVWASSVARCIQCGSTSSGRVVSPAGSSGSDGGRGWITPAMAPPRRVRAATLDTTFRYRNMSFSNRRVVQASQRRVPRR